MALDFLRHYRNFDLLSSADEVLCLIDAARSLVVGLLRIGAQWSRPDHMIVGHFRCEDLGRCLPLFAPFFDGRQRIEHVGTLSTSAVTHSWCHIQADGSIDLVGSQRFHQTLVIVH